MLFANLMNQTNNAWKWVMGFIKCLKAILCGFSLLFLSFLLGCSCPGGKEFHSLDGNRVNELKASIGKMSSKQLEDLARDFQMAKDFIPKQLIVKFKDGTTRSKVEETLTTLGAQKNYQFKSTKALLLTVPDAIKPTDIIAIVTALNEVESVDYASPNGVLKVSSVPNDPSYSQQDDLNNTGQLGGTSGADIKAERAWDITQGSRDVLVGVIDTGVDYTHPDLVDNIWTNQGEVGIDIEGNDKTSNGIDDDNNGYVDDVHGYDFANNDSDPMDDNGHGTHVAGTIGASGNNGIGITGIAWRVSLVPLKFISADGSGSEADAIKAIEYATAMNIPITNNSWGGLGYNQALKDAIEAAGTRGLLFVAAAGNNSVDNDIVNFFPANYELENIISVAAVDNKDAKPAFSNWGAQKVQIAAPGVEILSLAVSGSPEPLVRMSGTSMAAPHITGAAALIKSVFPDVDYRAIKSRILNGADRIPGLLSPTYTYENFRSDEYPLDNPLVSGGRRLNLEKSLQVDTIAPGPVENFRIFFSGLTSLELRFQSAGDDGNIGTASGYQVAISSRPITNETDWNLESKYEVTHIEANNDGLLRAELRDLNMLQKGYLTIRALDNVGNRGVLNPSISFELSAPKELFVSDGESYDGINTRDLFFWTTPFQQEEISGRGKVWSDSPNANREIGNNYMEFTEPITVNHPDVVLQFDTKFDCEPVYEKGLVEIRINEETDPHSHYNVWNPETNSYDWYQSPQWRMLAVYSAAKCDWATVKIPLRNKLKPGDKVRFRFWYKGGGQLDDGRDGWLIDDIKLLGPKSPDRPTQLTATQITETSPYVLNWNDNSIGETRFEVRNTGVTANDIGTLVGDTPINVTRYETLQTAVQPTLRVRACNGPICSDLSDPVRIVAPPPRLVLVSPTKGSTIGGSTLTVSGAAFQNGITVRVGEQQCNNVQLISSSQLTCRLSATPPGTYQVSVRNMDGQVNSAGPSPVFQFISPRWVGTNGGVCSQVCSTVGLFSKLSPEGSYCTSGEQIPASAVGRISFQYGCWPSKTCRAQGSRSTLSIGRFCYGASQRRDNGRTDVTMGCYCGL